jgi:hypothetical protein
MLVRVWKNTLRLLLKLRSMIRLFCFLRIRRMVGLQRTKPFMHNVLAVREWLHRYSVFGVMASDTLE